jgi:hypothetical protein
MKAVTIYVTDATAKQLVQLAKTGRCSAGDVAYRAFCLLTEHASPLFRGGLREIKVDGVTYLPPETLTYGKRHR